MPVSIVEFKKAVQALTLALAEPKSDIVRDASIQRFEFSVELAWKTARKKMGSASTAPKVIVREMAQAGLIKDAEKWLSYIDLRNLSSHTYNEALAEQVFEAVKAFLPEAKALLLKLEEM